MTEENRPRTAEQAQDEYFYRSEPQAEIPMEPAVESGPENPDAAVKSIEQMMDEDMDRIEQEIDEEDREKEADSIGNPDAATIEPDDHPEKHRKGASLDTPGGVVDTPILSGDGLPWQAFAVVVDRADPSTWHLPHHTKSVKKAIKGKIGYEHTVDWEAMSRMVYMLSRYGRQAAKLPLDPEQVLQAATHFAVHYIKAKKPVPDALAVLAQ